MKNIKSRFAINFVSAMKKLKKSRVVMSRRERYRAVREAARTAMASAVGPERAWSRAVLRNGRRKMKVSTSTSRGRQWRNPRGGGGGGGGGGGVIMGKEEDLRGLVPGAQQMGFCTLLTETAHYITCLQAQVQVMTHILNTCTSS